jgi:L-fucose isomerase
MLLLGNSRRETSSLVGLLGAGGALDQIGVAHVRVFDHHAEVEKRRIIAFARAASAARALKGQVLGLFGGRSLGMVTATADPAQWQRLFGVDIDPQDQSLIVQRAQALPAAEVKRHADWLAARLGGIQYGGRFTPAGLERQLRSYLATRELVRERGYQFVSVKCQPELSDGYASQCVVHMLMNSLGDADGEKPACVHGCEADADGALTMQILHLLSGGQPTALLDVRWLDRGTGTWTLANCGAFPAAFAATEADPAGLSAVSMVPHVFGGGGGGALPTVASAGEVTLARLCRSAGVYWMAILSGSLEDRSAAELSFTTAAFPQAFLRTGAGADFLEVFGSNHLHMVRGRYEAELEAFCRLKGLKWRRWT